MMLSELPDGKPVFLDANIFVYHFGQMSLDCKQLLFRCSDGDLSGYTSTAVIAEVLHRRMLIEAVTKELVRSKNALQQLKEHPEVITQLSQYNDDVAQIAHMNITILPLTQDDIAASADIRKTHGLFTNDSLIVAAMKRAGIINLATHDHDFERVSWLKVYLPTDIR